MIWSVIAWVLTAAGSILALRSGGGEVSLWLIAFGWVLEGALGLLARLGMRRLCDWTKAGKDARVLRIFGLSLVAISVLCRALGRVQLFLILIVIAVATWALALIRNISDRRTNYG